MFANETILLVQQRKFHSNLNFISMLMAEPWSNILFAQMIFWTFVTTNFSSTWKCSQRYPNSIAFCTLVAFIFTWLRKATYFLFPFYFHWIQILPENLNISSCSLWLPIFKSCISIEILTILGSARLRIQVQWAADRFDNNKNKIVNVQIQIHEINKKIFRSIQNASLFLSCC